MNYIKKLLPIAFASFGILNSATAASAVNFNFTYAPGTTFEQKVGFEMAGQIWSSYVKDDFTANIYVETTDSLPENVIGGALPGIESEKQYHEYRKDVEGDITSDADLTAMNGLSTLSHKYDVFQAIYDGDLKKGNLIKDMNRLNVTRANAKAIGMLSSSNDLDGYILMSNLSDAPVDWNYNVLGNSVPGSSLDYLSVALHEVGHVMGFVSGVDNPGWLSIMTEHEAKNELIKRDRIKFFNPLDLYRFTEESKKLSAVNISIGGNPYFSIDGGATNLGNFATGQATSGGGDGYQGSHWERRNSNVLGIMDPVLSVGQRRQITDLDLTAFDVIGYDRNDSPTINWDDMYDAAVNSATFASIQDRSADVEDMIDDSKIYEGRRRGGWGQEGFWQGAYFNSFNWQTIDAPADSKSVPEPGSTVGLLAMGVLGLGALVKRKKK